MEGRGVRNYLVLVLLEWKGTHVYPSTVLYCLFPGTEIHLEPSLVEDPVDKYKHDAIT